MEREVIGEKMIVVLDSMMKCSLVQFRVHPKYLFESRSV